MGQVTQAAQKEIELHMQGFKKTCSQSLMEVVFENHCCGGSVGEEERGRVGVGIKMMNEEQAL